MDDTHIVDVLVEQYMCSHSDTFYAGSSSYARGWRNAIILTAKVMRIHDEFAQALAEARSAAGLDTEAHYG